MKIVKTYDGELLYFDLAVWEFVFSESGYRVSTNSSGYKCVRTTKGEYRNMVLARVLLNCPEDKEVDHINGNPLDNRLCNLRIVTRQENKYNRAVSSTKKSKLPKGVCFNKATNKYQASIKHNGCTTTLGNFETIELAEDAYKQAAEKYFGKYAAHISREQNAT